VRVAQTVGQYLRAVAAGVPVVERVVGQSFSCQGVQPQQLARQGVEVLHAEVVRLDAVEVRPVATADVEGAIGPETHATDGVGVLVGSQAVCDVGAALSARRNGSVALLNITDVLEGAVGAEQDDGSACQSGRETSGGIGFNAHQARYAGTLTIGSGIATQGLNLRRVIDVRQVDVGQLGEARMHGDADQPSVTDVVDFGTDVKERRGVHGTVVDDLDYPTLLGHEHAAVGCESQVDGSAQPTDDRLGDETFRQNHALRGCSRQQGNRGHGKNCQHFHGKAAGRNTVSVVPWLRHQPIFDG